MLMPKNVFQIAKEEALEESKTADYKAHSSLTPKLKSELKAAEDAMHAAREAHAKLKDAYEAHLKKGQELRGYKPKTRPMNDLDLLEPGRSSERSKGPGYY